MAKKYIGRDAEWALPYFLIICVAWVRYLCFHYLIGGDDIPAEAPKEELPAIRTVVKKEQDTSRVIPTTEKPSQVRKPRPLRRITGTVARGYASAAWIFLASGEVSQYADLNTKLRAHYYHSLHSEHFLVSWTKTHMYSTHQIHNADILHLSASIFLPLILNFSRQHPRHIRQYFWQTLFEVNCSPLLVGRNKTISCI